MLILESGEVCPYADKCPHNTTYVLCYGARADRDNKFYCDLVENGKIKEIFRILETDEQEKKQ